MNESRAWQEQLLATKFFVPAFSHNMVSRTRLTSLLDRGLRYKLTLLSAPAGFGKTTLVGDWVHLQTAANSPIAWVTLEEGDNDPVRFWTYVLTSLNTTYQGTGQEALTSLRAPQAPPIQFILTTLINHVASRGKPCLLILDDYHVITEQAIHDTMSFLLEHQPPQLHITLLTRVDPPLALGRLRVRGQMLELRTDQLRFTSREAATFLEKATGLSLEADAIQAVETRTEGWIASLQLAALSLRGQENPTDLLAKLRGDHRSILDYLTDEVLRQQPTAIQHFLQATAILERLSAPLCDALLEQSGSQEVLEYLERANLFIVPLDSERRWYRYHALFAEALRHRLQHLDGVDVPAFHLRASRWYAGQGSLDEAIPHALLARQWTRAADLIETYASPLSTSSWTVRRWLLQLPQEIVRLRPRLCLAYARNLILDVQLKEAEPWLEAAEMALLAPPSLAHEPAQVSEGTEHNRLVFPSEQERDRLLGEILAYHAHTASHFGESEKALTLGQQAITHLSDQDHYEHGVVSLARSLAYFSEGQVRAAAQNALDSSTSSHAAGWIEEIISNLGFATLPLHLQGQLHAAWRLCERALQLESEAESVVSALIGVIYARQADILREWNQLDKALEMALRGLQLIGQPGYRGFDHNTSIVLTRIYLARGDITAASEALQQTAQAPLVANSPYYRSWLLSVEQARLWLARGELERAAQWMRERAQGERPRSPFAREREELARARILLAQAKSTEALDVLATLLIDAQTAERWDHVIEMLLLQALAYHMCHEMQQAFMVLAQAVSLAEPEGYMRRFLDEGPSMATLLSKLREQERRKGPTLYLDSLLEAFFPEKRTSQVTKTGKDVSLHSPMDPLSERELEVLRLLARGASNQEIAEKLVVAVSTVKHHVSMILSKLGAGNRTQAVARARDLGLLSDES